MNERRRNALHYWHRMNVARYEWEAVTTPGERKQTRDMLAVCKPDTGWDELLGFDDLHRNGKGYVDLPARELRQVGLLDEAQRTYL